MPKLVGHVDHRQGPEKFRALVEEFALGVHDGADHAHDRAAALFDAFDQPAGVADVVGQEFRVFLSLLGPSAFAIHAADVQVRGRVVGHFDFVAVGFFIVIDDRIRRDRRVRRCPPICLPG
jgi:hypothetical protein